MAVFVRADRAVRVDRKCQADADRCIRPVRSREDLRARERVQGWVHGQVLDRGRASGNAQGWVVRDWRLRLQAKRHGRQGRAPVAVVASSIRRPKKAR